MIPYTWSFLLMLLFLLTGYATGRRIGIRYGRSKGEAQTRIFLREESLRAGRCKTCDRPFN